VLVVRSNQYNALMARSEVNCVFEGMSGRISRITAVATISKELKYDVAKVVLVRMIGRTGTSDLHALFYLYEDIKEAHKQLPSHLFSRLIPHVAKDKEPESKAEKIKDVAKDKEPESKADNTKSR